MGEATKAGAPLLSFFWDLAAVDVDKRVKAATSLVDVLQRAQHAHNGAEGPTCPDLAYAVRRLVRGLASSRDGARQGFGAALIEVLATFPTALSAPRAAASLPRPSSASRSASRPICIASSIA